MGSLVAPVVALQVGSLTLGAGTARPWTTVRLHRSIETLCHEMACGYLDRVSAQAQPLPIHAGDQVQLLVNGAVALSGYVDDANESYDADDYRLEVTGRSAAGDLVDCSAVSPSGAVEYLNKTILQIASDLLQPFNLTASSDVDVSSSIPQFQLQSGETVHDALERAGKYIGVLLTSDPTGNVVFTRAGTSKSATQLVWGGNILSGEHRSSARARFQSYTMKGQSRGSGGGSSSTWDGAQASQITASATDSGVQRYRALVLVADDQGTMGLQGRVTWERNVRVGRMHRYIYKVQGWSCAEGLWTPNVLVHVQDPRFGLDDDLLIVSAEMVRDENGTTTTLDLGWEEGFDIQGLPPPKKGKRKKSLSKASVKW